MPEITVEELAALLARYGKMGLHDLMRHCATLEARLERAERDRDAAYALGRTEALQAAAVEADRHGAPDIRDAIETLAPPAGGCGPETPAPINEGE